MKKRHVLLLICKSTFISRRKGVLIFFYFFRSHWSTQKGTFKEKKQIILITKINVTRVNVKGIMDYQFNPLILGFFWISTPKSVVHIRPLYRKHCKTILASTSIEHHAYTRRQIYMHSRYYKIK